MNDLDVSNYDVICKRKLILHFDQHNTIQVACMLPGRSVTVEEGLNNFLTTAVWGKVVDDKWKWISNEPQLLKPEDEPDAITYFKYLEKKIVFKADDRIEFKIKTSKFVYEEPGKRFKEYFDLYLESLKYDQNESDTEPCNTIPSGDPANKSLYNLILPCFFDMIRRLQQRDRKFTIILRTMGIDSKNFLQAVKPVLEGKHRDFKDIKPMDVNTNVGKIIRNENDKIKLIMDGKEYNNDHEIYEKLSSLSGINAIRDDFDHWQKHNYECYSAKPLWIDPHDNTTQHIIFDDNIRIDSFDDCIVNVRLKNIEENKFKSIDFNCYHLFETSNILQPNLIELLNPLLKKDSKKNHYFEKLIRSEIKYHLILDSASKFKLKINSGTNNSFKKIKPSNEPDKTQSLNTGDDDELKSKRLRLTNQSHSFVYVNESFTKELEDKLDRIDTKHVSKICMIQ